MKKILFPTDFSPAAHNAYQYAIAMAKDMGAKIELIHIYTVPFSATDIYLDLTKQRALRVKKQKEKEQEMQDFVNQYDFKNIGDLVVYPGVFIDQEIVERTRKGDDLVIMGTKGERNAVDKLMGSVTTRLMMNAACPVLAIPEGAKYNGMKTITYATTLDFSDTHFLEELAQFGKQFGSNIRFVHVTDDPKIELEEDLYLEDLPFEAIHFSIINTPSVMEGIDQYLEEHKSDALALYIPKRQLWERLFHTSFSKKMTFHTNTPLYVFHE